MDAHAQVSEQIKEQQRSHWGSVAEGWGRWLEWTELNFAPITTWLVEACGAADGTRLLDAACGAGYPALDLARAVRPGGRVTAVDLAPQMAAVAARHARAAGLDHLAFDAMDAESLRFGDGAFDAVTCAYGLMFCPDPARALAEFHRVLAPRGRVGLVVWDEPMKSPFFTSIRGPAEQFLALQPPPPDAPGPFRLASASALEALLAGAGFTGVRVESLPMTVECGSVDEYCTIFTDYAWRSKVAALPAETLRRFRDAVADATRPYGEGGRLRLVATSLCATGRR